MSDTPLHSRTSAVASALAVPSMPGRTVASPPPIAWLRTSALPVDGRATALPSNIGSTASSPSANRWTAPAM